jgi:hypothetical protein
MPFAPGNKLSKGRPKGAVNKSTEDVKQLIVRVAEGSISNIEKDLARIRRKNPEKAVELALKLLEYVAPKLKSVDISGHVEQRIHQISVNINGTNDKHNGNVSEPT